MSQPKRISDGLVVVSLATYRTPPELLQRAIVSVLNQTHTDLILVVVNDGGPPLPTAIRDERLVVLNLRENNGQYFCHDVVITAFRKFPNALWKMHDSDDWSDPEALASLVSHAERGAVFAPFFVHTDDGKIRIRTPNITVLESPREQVNRPRVRRAAYSLQRLGIRVPSRLWYPWKSGASWAPALFRISRVLEAGGLHPEFRVGYDSYFVRMVSHTGPVVVQDVPTYHYNRTKLRTSLSTSRDTGPGSKIRIESMERQIRIDREAFGAPNPAAFIRGTIGDESRERVAAYARELRYLCGL